MDIAFGRELKEKHFLLEPDAVLLNNGSYGAVPKRVFNKQLSLRYEMEQHPDSWYRRKSIINYRDSLQLLCQLISSEFKNTVFVENATFGTNSVLQSIKWNAGDVIVITNLTFYSVRVMCRVMEEKYGTKTVEVNIPFPIDHKDQILKLYKEALQQNPNIKLAIIDHITSPSSVLMPVRELSDLCHDHNVMSMVDGAHALGQVGLPINVPDMNADFYTGNIHKWMFTPRGAGYLWIDTKHLSLIRPTVVSHFHGISPQQDFCIRGTNDDTSYYTLNEAVTFVKDIGGWDAVYTYNTELIEKAVKELTASWNTERFPLPVDMTAQFMRLIRLPDMVNYSTTPVGASNLENDLFHRFNIQTLCREIQAKLYVRLSVHVYNDIHDFEKLRDAVLTLMSEPKKESTNVHDKPIMYWDLNPLSTV